MFLLVIRIALRENLERAFAFGVIKDVGGHHQRAAPVRRRPTDDGGAEGAIQYRGRHGIELRREILDPRAHSAAAAYLQSLHVKIFSA